MFLNNRYHDPVTGQFISVDPLVQQTGEPYVYGAANPTTLSDPSGLCSSFVMNAKGDWTCTFYTGDDGSRSVDNQGGDLCNRGARICSVDQGKLPADYVFGDQKPEKYRGIPTSLLVYQPPEEPVDRLLDTVSPECDEICLAATGATALTFGGLTATACPAGTAASAGSAAVAACWGLGVFSVGATTSVYEKTKSRAEQGGVDGSAVLCSMAAGGAVPPGTDVNALVRPIAGRVLKGLSC